MEGKVGWSAEVEPLFHSGQDDERILFCQSPLIWEEAVAFPHLFLVFEVYLVDVNALLERAAFFPLAFPGVPLSASPAFWDLLLKEFRSMIFQPCAD